MSTTSALKLETHPILDGLSRELNEIQRELGVPRRFLDDALGDPLADFLGRPSRSFRARLIELSWQLAGGAGPVPDALVSSIETLHAGSLIIDDIEDGSSARREGAALHMRYGLPLALNAGNWLYFWSATLLDELDPKARAALRVDWANTVKRCHVGQALDLSVNVASVSQRELPGLVRAITRLKTGELVALSARMAARLAGAPSASVDALSAFGLELGTALQMADDLGGITRQSRRLKGHEDLLGGRPTWPWAWLAETLDPYELSRLQLIATEVRAGETHPEELAERLRDALGARGKLAVRQTLAAAIAALEARFAGAPALDDVRAELARLEVAYA